MALIAVWALAGTLLTAGTPQARAAEPAKRPYSEALRPQFHFSPPAHWMNDPNGMVYAAGEYHLFYQYNPLASVWGPMHWGHAVSADLLHWRHLPIALYPDERGTIYSGSVVYDTGNTSHFGSAGRPALVALFTQTDEALKAAGRSDFQSQSLAFSLDRGRSWTRFAGNPVIPNPGLRDFRDPKVFWYGPGQRWIATLAAGDHVTFYSSADLRSWRHESDFGVDHGAHGGVWECPDLVPMRIESEGTPKYGLLVSVIDGAPNGGSGTQYFIGDFDGHQFTVERQPGTPTSAGSRQAPAWIDWGTDDYAGVTWSGAPHPGQRPVFLGWMSNWQYAQKVPTERWRGAMTLPRQLSLVRSGRRLEIRSAPLPQLKRLRSAPRILAAGTVRGERSLVRGQSTANGLLELELTLDLQQAKMTVLSFGNSVGEHLDLRMNRAAQRFELDRSSAGAPPDPVFARSQYAPLCTDVGAVALHVFVDRTSIEIFIDGGATTFTALDFPSKGFDRVTLRADAPVRLVKGYAYSLRSIW